MDSNLIFLSLGSNVGDKQNFIEQAVNQLSFYIGAPIKKSSLYETAPWGYINQEEFLNQVIAIQTKLEPKLLLNKLLQIESDLGRIRTVRNAPRTIDLDILIYKESIINQTDLIIPHPRLQLRKFILIPMTEIAPDLIHPVFHLNMKELLKVCKDNSSVKKRRHHEIKS